MTSDSSFSVIDHNYLHVTWLHTYHVLEHQLSWISNLETRVCTLISNMLALSVIIPLALVRTPWICSLRVFDSFSSRFLMGTLNGWNLGRFPLLAVSLVPLYWVVWYSVQLPIFSFLKRLELCAFSQFFIWRFCLVRSSCIVFLHSILLHNFRDQGFLQQRSGGWCTASFSTAADTSTSKGKSCFFITADGLADILR